MTPTLTADTGQEKDMLGQTVVVIGGSSGIGLETARLARAHGADVVLAARDPNRLRDAAEQVDARSTASFDATDPDRVEQFFEGLPEPIDHVLVTGSGPYYSTLAEMDFAKAQRDVVGRILGRSRSPAPAPPGCDRPAPCCSSAAPAAAKRASVSRSSRR